jgi:exopolysaccharide biosynthesis polyprenyl glycosylphosphotransferase
LGNFAGSEADAGSASFHFRGKVDGANMRLRQGVSGWRLRSWWRQAEQTEHPIRICLFLGEPSMAIQRVTFTLSARPNSVADAVIEAAKNDGLGGEPAGSGRAAEGRVSRGPVEPLISPAENMSPRAPGTQKYQVRVIATDIVIVCMVSVLTVLVRFGFDDPAHLASSTALLAVSYQFVAVITACLWVGWLWMQGCWTTELPGDGPTELKRILQSSVSLFAVVITADYLLDLQVARSFLLVALPVGCVGMVAARLWWRGWLRRRREHDLDLMDMLVIGGRVSAVRLAKQLSRAPNCGYRIVGMCVPRPDEHPRVTRTSGVINAKSDFLGGFPVIGDFADVVRAIDVSRASVVAVAATDAFGAEAVRSLSWTLEGTGIKLVVAPALTEISRPRVQLKPVAGLPLLRVVEPCFRGPRLVTKTAMDLLLALTAIVMLSPLMALIALSIKLDDRGPVFFSQQRVGLRGESFRMWKFRSMGIDAESLQTQLNSLSEGNGVLFKLKVDPRVTRVGQLLRRYSLDELPQLANVLLGQMSLVGPRPPLPTEVAQYSDEAHRRLLVKPGMTGLWQISGRSNLSWEESVRLDLFYVENWSPTGDLVILAQTVKAMLSPDGAY